MAGTNAPQHETIVRLTELEDTLLLGRQLGELAGPGDVITLAGGLGTGKTTLTQAIGAGLEVPQHSYITSPTFSLLHEYQGRIPLYHFDLYRLSDPEELEQLGFDEYFYGEGLAVIEWPDRLGYFLPDKRLELHLTFTGPESREARLLAYGTLWKNRLTQLKADR